MSDRVKESDREGVLVEDRTREEAERAITTDDVAKSAEHPVSPPLTSQPVSETTPLLDKGQEQDFRLRWDGIQTGFVDAPREAVQQADSLVAELMQHLAKSFSDERKKLEVQWSQGKEVSTEDLRIALQKYRSFFGRLLSI